MFDSLYAKDLRKARATSNFDDDLAVSKDLLKAIEDVKDHPALVTLICQEIYALASSRLAGYETAAEAALALAQHVPSKKADALDMAINVQQKQFARANVKDKATIGSVLISELVQVARLREQEGDLQATAAAYKQTVLIARVCQFQGLNNLIALHERAQTRHTLTSRLADLEEQLLRDASRTDIAKQLAMAYLVELNNPKEAKRYAARAKDDALSHVVELSSKTIASTTDQELMTLGGWHLEQAKAAEGKQRYAFNLQAIKYYDLFLLRATKKDLMLARAQLASDQLNGEIRKHERLHGIPPKTLVIKANATSTTLPKGRWVELMNVVDPALHRVRDHVPNDMWIRADDGSLQMIKPTFQRKHYGFRLPVNIDGYYDFRAVLTMQDLPGDIAFYGPKGEAGLIMKTFKLNGKSGSKLLIQFTTSRGPANTVRFQVFLNNATKPAISVDYKDEPDAGNTDPQEKEMPRYITFKVIELRANISSMLVRLNEGRGTLIHNKDWPYGKK